MTELSGAGLLDSTLIAMLGPVDTATAGAIAGICDDAVSTVLGPSLAGAVRAAPQLVPLIAPWVKDLARGLQFQSRHGAAEPDTRELLTCLASRPMAAAQVRRFAETIDLAATLTLGRVTEHVLGPGASSRNPAENEAAAPWLTGLKLGYRIGLVLELLQLASSQ